ncbi:hypothetical protein PMAYCL1PPCAC_21179 [Pristionchus mayeri]|uniref:Guanylate cyclase n=1 Tax=Pristionchus mayeri TaxID=1317129 RepID=A0AAN5I487_9BILA|nr:hypothetical protein PMAYCL1PPCAC_21179 [Pristionchus mayeri]
MRRCRRKRLDYDNQSNESTRARAMTGRGGITGVALVLGALMTLLPAATAVQQWEEEEIREITAQLPWEELVAGAGIITRNGGVKRWIDSQETTTVSLSDTVIPQAIKKSRRLRQATEAPTTEEPSDSDLPPFYKEYCTQDPRDPKFTEIPVENTKDHRIHILVPLPTTDDSAVGRYHGRNPFEISKTKVRPVIDFALDYIYDTGILPRNSLEVTYADSALSDAKGPNVAIEALKMKKLHCVIGYAFVYALAPVARMAPYWTTHTGSCGVPVITTIGNTGNLDDKSEYRLMTRIASPYKVLRLAVAEFIKKMNWTKVTYLFHDYRSSGTDKDVSVPVSECFLLMASIRPYLTTYFTSLNVTQDFNYFMFNQDKWTRLNYMVLLKKMSEISNVIILCASPDTVREIMLSAHELGMTKGHYVFINIDVSTGSHAERPWERFNMTNDNENDKAKEAYRALKTISLRRSDQKEYREFEMKVRERAEKQYSYKKNTGKEYEMNNFISAFYDAVLLYAIALNETIAENKDPRNGHLITQHMWNKTFQGITGTVSIDANGDRYSDYSLLDLDPEKDKFVEVAYYSGKDNSLTQSGQFHWIGGKPPVDDPVCAWDFHKCPKGYPLHVYLLIGAAIVILMMALLFVFFWRRYRLEQELAAKSWMIRWEELDGEERTKANGKKKSKSKKSKNGDGITEGDPLLRSGSRTTLTSDKRSSSSGATRKISAMIDRKLSIFTRKKSSPNAASNMEKGNGGPSFNHIGELKETSDGEISPVNEVSFQLPFGHEDGERRRKVSISSPQLSSSPDYTNKKSSTEEEGEYPTSKRSIIGAMMMRRKSGRKLSFGDVTSIKSHGGGSIETIAMQQGGQVYTKTACYKGTIVAIKMLSLDMKKYPKLDLTRQHLMDFKRMKDLQHDHITRFTGACVDAPNYCIVTEYCSKGSLEDILENEKIELDSMMKYSLLHDLVKGMYFIHNSEIRTHGKLKSSNCVVDSRFVLKVTDFGLSTLHAMEESGIEAEGEFAYYKRQLWTSPELLRDPNRTPAGTQKGDIYSFAIILHEMMYRKGAFWCEDELGPQEIIENVRRKPLEPEDIFRPYCPVNEGLLDPQIVEMMRLCWSEEVTARPDFAAIRKAVRGINKDNETSNLVDNLLKRMEQYASNLEGLVEERTQEYLGEKKKVEDLLHQLLPPAIADTLIAGRAVQAEHYECVTIYFSDIVGFTALSSMSTPMQVVTLLNDLYLAFDGVVDNFKVYKVETIGDAYMVVSGLPERRDDHASQIAQMSIALLHKVKTFVIRHRPNDQLKLRIGMHSGSVVAGVVGSKMPRYCLFGDTVNTSSRMESNGLPLRIHVSMQTKEILSADPGFRLDLRGEVEMKGKGKQTTYWLKGYKETDIPDFGPEFRH